MKTILIHFMNRFRRWLTIAALAFLALVIFVWSAEAAWTLTNQVQLGYGKNYVAFKVRLTGDGTTLTKAENLTVDYPSTYVGKGWELWECTIINPASGGPGDTWNLEIQDSYSDKSIIDESAISNTASTAVSLDPMDVTGKPETVWGPLRLISDDTDLGNTQYVDIIFIFKDI